MDFDSIEEATLRRRSGTKWVDCPADVLPAWVADMDFPVAEPIVRAMQAMIAADDLGYPVDPRLAGVPDAFARRMQQRFGWQVDPDRIEVITDVVQGLQIAVSLFSEPGDELITPTPIYPPFLETLEHFGRRAVWMRFERGADGYRIDVDRLRAELTPRTRMLLLCNPHNPTGRVLTREELAALAQIAVERDLVIVSDEIHAELVYPGAVHVPTAMLGPEVAARTITLTSATKAFNIAGLRCAVAVFGTGELQQRFGRVHRHMRGGIGSLGVAATLAAWSGDCAGWQDAVMAYLLENRDMLAQHVARRWPGCVHITPQGTYLSWIDCSGLSLPDRPQPFFLEHARVRVSDGIYFGAGHEQCIRVNFATPRAILGRILARMDAVVAGGG